MTNPVYIGPTRHGRVENEGQHPPIIDEAQWQRVQKMLTDAAGRKRGDASLPDPGAALTGRLVDDTGDRLTPTPHAEGRAAIPLLRLQPAGDRKGRQFSVAAPARALEQALAAGNAAHLRTRVDQHDLLTLPDLARHDDLLRRLELSGRGAQAESAWVGLIESGKLERDAATLVLSPERGAAFFGLCPEALAPSALLLSVPLALRRRGVEQRLVIGSPQNLPDTQLVAHLTRTRRWLGEIRRGREIRSLAKADGVSEGCLRLHLQLAFLAPAIQQAILDGTQPEALTVHRLTRPEMPADWAAQYARTGISPVR
ncbi:recombinase family protein [Paracoccus sp. S-4012]|uniref:recombinase family protein n=1 Tax=Paracoccus sp. S-4012 TaxID=2665648 RepID=UPI001E5A3B8D|nr:recombinase family protein [Paracoccus sp. S-4012]